MPSINHTTLNTIFKFTVMDQEEIVGSLYRSVSPSIGKFQIVDTIDRGGTGYIFLISAITTSKKYALKAIYKRDSSRKECKDAIRRAKSEVQIHKGLKNRYVIQLDNVIQDTDYYYLVMEYCKRGDLAKIIHSHYPKGMPMDKVKHYGLQILKGVSYLHKNNIVHGDLKPQNTLITDEEEIKICDFGASIRVEPGQKTKSTRGTINYLAPEIFDMHDYKVDIWAFGCVLYFLAVGTHPFKFKDLKDRETVLTKNNLQNFNYDQKVSPQLKHLLQKILVIDPEDRIQLKEIVSHCFFTGEPMPLEKVEKKIHQEVQAISLDKKDKQRTHERKNKSTYSTRSQNCNKENNMEEANSNYNSKMEVLKTNIDKKKEYFKKIQLIRNAKKVQITEIARRLSPLNTLGMTIAPIVSERVKISIDLKGLTLDYEGKGIKINVSPDGKHITIGRNQQQKQYRLQSLPEKYWKHYEDCKKTVKTIQGSTVKVELAIANRRYQYMWNGLLRLVSEGPEEYEHEFSSEAEIESSRVLPHAEKPNIKKYFNLLMEATKI